MRYTYMAQSSEDYHELHEKLLSKFSTMYAAVRDERRQCIDDRRFCFIPGAQYEGELEELYENRPRFEVNKTHIAVQRINNEYLNNKITVDFKSRGGDSDGLSDLCDGLYRADEVDSSGQEAYGNAFKEHSSGGIGAWRYTAQYEDEEYADTDYQRIKIVPIYDADKTVYFDLGAKEQDKSDAKWCYVLTATTREDYENDWGKTDFSTWPIDDETYDFDWVKDDSVYIAEYFEIKIEKEKLYVYDKRGGGQLRIKESEFKRRPGYQEEVETLEGQPVLTRTIKRKRCRKVIMSGDKILSEWEWIPGPNIPIVMTFGQRVVVENIERAMGHVRLAKDMQRLKNMQITGMAELAALSVREKPIVSPEQIEGFEQDWAEDNILNFPYLQLNAMTDKEGNPLPAGPLGHTRVPQIPPAMAALLALTDMDMKELLGNPEAGDQIRSNISEGTVMAFHERLDMQTYIYMSGLAVGLKRGGDIWMGMAGEIYVEAGREMNSIGETGDVSQVTLAKAGVDETGAVVMENDLAHARMNIVSAVGPSSTSKRSAISKAVTSAMGATKDPETQQILGYVLLRNWDDEGMGGVREYARKKLVAMGVEDPTKDDKERMQAEAEVEDPNAQFLAASAAEANAKAEKAHADTVKTLADAELSEAKKIETLTNAEETRQSMTIQAGQIIDQQLAEINGNLPAGNMEAETI